MPPIHAGFHAAPTANAARHQLPSPASHARPPDPLAPVACRYAESVLADIVKRLKEREARAKSEEAEEGEEDDDEEDED